MSTFSNKTNISSVSIHPETVYHYRMWHPTFNLPVRKWVEGGVGGYIYFKRDIRWFFYLFYCFSSEENCNFILGGALHGVQPLLSVT